MLTTSFILNNSFVSASSNYEKNYDEMHYNTNSEVEQNSASAVAIFVGGVLVGYLVDGVIEYTTGHNASYWVANGLEWVEKALVGTTYPPGYYIIVTKEGNMSVCDSSGNCQINANNLSKL